jgi:hypothetical protein
MKKNAAKFKKIEDVTADKVCEIFGEFEDFRQKLITMQLGTFPPSEHPNALIISVVSNSEGWWEKPRDLRRLKAVCYSCKNHELFSKCKLSLKAMVGECQGLEHEVRMEMNRIQQELYEKEQKAQRRKK